MNLAIRDIRQGLPRFLISVAGVGLLLTACIGMIGLYRGIVHDATLLIEAVDADLWVVQGDRAGPFAEASTVAAAMDRRVAGVPGVERTRRFLQVDQQIERDGATLRAAIVALDAPADPGGWIGLTRGRALLAGQREAVVDASLGFALGEEIVLGRERVTVVGMTEGMVNGMGDGLMFLDVNDAAEVARRRTNEEIRLARAGAAALRGPAESKIAAILVDLAPGADAAAVRATVEGWGDAEALSSDEQRALFLDQRLWRLRVQILAFNGVLLAVAALVITVMVYTMTIEKLHQIALLKLLGARDRFIAGMIVQQAALMAIGGYGVGVAAATLVFPFFPRRVVIEAPDLAALLVLNLIIGVAAASLGVRRAMAARAQEVLS